MLLGRESRNEIADAILSSTFPRATLSVDEQDDAIVLVHLPSKSRLTLSIRERKWMGDWAILTEPPRVTIGSPGSLTTDWLVELDHILGMPDLWAELMNDADGDPNTPFDATEQAEVAAWAAELEQNAAERYGLGDEQMKVLVGQLRELVEASGRLGRKDWYNAAIGSLVGIVMNRVVEVSVAQQVLESMVSTLGHLFGHPIPQLGAGPMFGAGP